MNNLNSIPNALEDAAGTFREVCKKLDYMENQLKKKDALIEELKAQKPSGQFQTLKAVLNSTYGIQMTPISICGESLDSLSWEVIKNICDAGAAEIFFHVGQIKTISLKNGKDIMVRIIGINHDVDKNGAPCPLTWETVNLWEDPRAMNANCSNKGGWEDSDMRKWLLNNVLELFPDELSTVICNTIKSTTAGGTSDKMVKTADKLFLLSEQEVFGRQIYSKGNEGHWYDWYRQENTLYGKKYPGGERGWRWLRSPYGSNSTSFCSIYSSGSANGSYASNSDGVSFGFCI